MHSGNTIHPIDLATPDTRFAIAVAEFGMLLSESPHRGGASYAQVLDLCTIASDHYSSDRLELIDMVRKTETLLGTRS